MQTQVPILQAREGQNHTHKEISSQAPRSALIRLLLIQNPNFLVLDEPTNDLDIVTLNVLEEYLQQFKGCVIIVSHDRYFMDKVVDHLLAFQGNAIVKDFPGNYSDYRDWKDEQDAIIKANEVKATTSPKEEQKQQRTQQKEEKRKLTFNEKREFEELDKLIPQLEAEKVAIEEALSSGNLSNDELISKSQRVSELIDEIDEKTMRWLELSEWV